jgi:hypothetical protein
MSKSERRSKEIEKRSKQRQIKEKKNVGNRKYGQGQAKHARKGIYSCMIAGLILILLFIMLGISYVSEGETTALLGAWGLGTLILSWVGLITGIKGLREREKNYVTCKVGIWCNVTLVVLFFVIFVRGLL